MQRAVNIQDFQQITVADLRNVSAFPRESFDAVFRDLAGFPAPRYTGFIVEQTGVSDVTASTGRFVKPTGEVYLYDAEGGAVVDLLDHLPAVAKRIATIVVYGATVDTDLEPRTFLIDAETGQTEGREVATESRRQAYVDKVLGQESATPVPAAISSDYVAVAHVTLTPAGVESIEQVDENRLTSLRDASERIADHDARFEAVGPQIDTLKTDVSALAAELLGKAAANFVAEIARGMGRVKETIGLPEDYASYDVDHFLTGDETDTAHVDYAALVEEGVRFPHAAVAKTAIALENPLENRVKVNDNMALPDFVENLRLRVRGKDGEYPLTSTTVETVQLTRLFETRTRRVYHESKVVCTNGKWWRQGDFDDAKGIFERAGETFEVENAVRQHSSNGNIFVRVSRYTEETYQEPYWSRVKTQETVSGSVVSQTFLNSQDGWCTGFNLYFSKVAASGNVRVLIVETEDGEPRLNRVIADTTLQPSDLKTWPAATPASVKPSFLVKGRRYGLVLISNGAHFVATVRGNKFAQGTLFYSTDGAYVQGDLQTDLAFDARFAVFRNPIVTVGLDAVELAGGIDQIDINADSIAPPGTRLEWQVRIGGTWRTLGPDEGIFASRPSLAQLRVRMIGTTDVMPSVGLGASRSAIEVSRPSTALSHISAERTTPAPVSQVVVTFRLEGWDGAHHDATVSLLTGAGFATVETADVIADAADPANANAIIRTATFNLAAPVSSYKIRLDGSTDTDAISWHAAERADLAFA